MWTDQEPELTPQEELRLTRMRAGRAARALRTGRPGRPPATAAGPLRGIAVGLVLTLAVALVVAFTVLLDARREKAAREKRTAAVSVVGFPGAAAGVRGAVFVGDGS